MTDKLENPTSEQIMEFLPGAVKRACDSYHSFMEMDFKTADSKKFAEHQNAGKAAAAHIHLLAKLTQWAGLEQKMQKNEDFAAFLETAKNEVDSYDLCIDDLA